MDPFDGVVLRHALGKPIALAAFGGQPIVVAFLDGDPGPVAAGDMDAVRAQLRGLGAALLVVERAGLWCLRPDDQPQLFATMDDVDAGDLRAARRAFGLDGRQAAALFVLDGNLRLRFSHVAASQTGPSFAALVEALALAGRQLAASRPGLLLLTRREMVVASLVGAFSLALLDGCATGRAPAPAAASAVAADDGELEVTLEVNGTSRPLRIDPRVTLLDALRERLGLTGTKKGCDHGQCGACTVLVGGRRVNACLTLAIMVQGTPITTIEGLARGDALHPVQAAFIAEDALQCGYCTPGQIMSAVALLDEGRARTDAEVREQMSGNICRCAAYPNIVAAIQRARKGA